MDNNEKFDNKISLSSTCSPLNQNFSVNLQNNTKKILKYGKKSSSRHLLYWSR